jgi:O-antigen ligase
MSHSPSRPFAEKNSDRQPPAQAGGGVEWASKSTSEMLTDIWRGFRSEHAAFLVACLYLVFEYNRPHLVYPVIDIIPWGKTLLVIGCFLAVMDKSSTWPPSAAWRPMIAFSGCVLLSMVFAFSPSTAIANWTFYFTWFFVVLMFTAVVSTRDRLFFFMVVYFLCNLKMAQHGFRTWALRGFSFTSWGVTGSPGWFQNSGEFSLQMVVFLPLVIAYIAAFRKDWPRWVRMFFYLSAVMAVGSVIAGGSRGGILGLVVVGLWCLGYSRHRVRTFIIIALAGVVVFMAMPAEFKERFETAGEDQTSLSRLTYWDHGMEAIGNNPLFGIGYKNWTRWVSIMHPETVADRGPDMPAEVIHNTYLEAATELGLLGAMAYIYVLLKIFLTNRRSARIAHLQKDRFLEATAAGLNGGLVSYLVPSYFMSVLYYPYVWVLLAFSVCLSTVCHRD